MAKDKKINIGDKVRTKQGEGLTVIATTEGGAYCMHVTPLHKPHKDAKYIRYKDLTLWKET